MAPIMGGSNPAEFAALVIMPEFKCPGAGVTLQRAAFNGAARPGAAVSLNSSPRYCVAYLCHNNAVNNMAKPVRPDKPIAISTKSWRTVPAMARADRAGGNGARYLAIATKTAGLDFPLLTY